MNESVKYLTSLAQVLGKLGLYPPGHPARAQGIDATFAQLKELQQVNPRPHFSFLDGSVIYGQRMLHEMRSWPWATRLADAGIQRLEFPEDVTREDYEAFINELLATLCLPGADETGLENGRRSGIRYGAVSLGRETERAIARTPETAVSLAEEAEVARWLMQTAEHKKSLPLTEVEALVSALSVAMHADSVLLVPLIELRTFDEYTAMHSINVAMLTMSLAESLGLGPRDTHAFGVAGLLHDVGMVRVPPELAVKDSLTRAEQGMVERHPLEGAKLLLEGDTPIELAAVVAYEHHMRPDGRGYPALPVRREPHYASKLVQVCSVYDALRSPRAFRPAWPGEQALEFIMDGAGSHFDADVASAFVRLMQRMEGRPVGV